MTKSLTLPLFPGGLSFKLCRYGTKLLGMNHLFDYSFPHFNVSHAEAPHTRISAGQEPIHRTLGSFLPSTSYFPYNCTKVYICPFITTFRRYYMDLVLFWP